MTTSPGEPGATSGEDSGADVIPTPVDMTETLVSSSEGATAVSPGTVEPGSVGGSSGNDSDGASHPQQAEMPFALVLGEPVVELPKDLYIPPDALEVFLETFEGPLDLLLYLIRRQNLDILDIPIAEITRQYVEYVELMREMRLELAAEYLVMAAMLAEIKARMLMPRQPAEGEEFDPDLGHQRRDFADRGERQFRRRAPVGRAARRQERETGLVVAVEERSGGKRSARARGKHGHVVDFNRQVVGRLQGQRVAVPLAGGLRQG